MGVLAHKRWMEAKKSVIRDVPFASLVECYAPFAIFFFGGGFSNNRWGVRRTKSLCVIRDVPFASLVDMRPLPFFF